jgi:MYXO-CTERM domain-containing protein
MRAWLLVLLLVAVGCSGEPDAPPLNPLLRAAERYGTPLASGGERHPFTAQGFNAYIISAAKAFGQADYLWEGDGVTRKIYYQGALIAQPYAAGKCHCVGATFQVYMTAFEAWDKTYGGSAGSLKGLTVAQVKKMRQIWYVATSDEAGSAAALPAYGLGAKVSDGSKARQGDVVQLWRNNGSGHSVIFDHWVVSGGKTTGIAYFSCQSSGPGFVSEVIGTGTKEVDAKRIYIGHPAPPVTPPDGAPPADGSAASDATGEQDRAEAGRTDLPPPLGDSAPTQEPSDAGCSCRAGGQARSGGVLLLALAVLALALRRRASRGPV